MGLVLDQLGGIHLEGLCQLADVVYPRTALPVATLQAADVVRMQAGLCAQLRA